MKIVNVLLYIIVQLYTTFLLLKCYGNLKNDNIRIKGNLKLIIIVIFVSLLIFINNNYNFTSLRLLVSLFIEFILFYTYFKDSIKETIYRTIIILLFTATIELIIALIIPTSISNYILNDFIIGKLILSIIVFKISDLLTNIEKIKIYINKLYNLISKKIFLKVILLIVILIIDFSLYLRINKFTYSFITITTNLIYICITLCEIIKNNINIEKLNAKNKELISAYETYRESFDKYRELKHNLKNDLLSLKSCIKKDKQIILNELIKKYNENTSWINDITKVPEGIQGIIYLKKVEAEKKKIELIVNNKSKLRIREKDYIDICDSIGILLDNAIEAAETSKTKNILIDIFDKDNTLNIKVINCFNNALNADDIGKKNYSTKKRKSGIGLYYLKKLNNKNIKIKNSIINNLFFVTITYYAKNNEE